MIKKLVVITAFGAGYVLGAHAGRARYEQIKRIALRIKDDPRVRHTVEDVGEAIREQGSAASDKITGHHSAQSEIMPDPLSRSIGL